MIETFHLGGEGRLQADITNLGGRIMRLVVDGVDVVHGFDEAEDYLPERHLSDFGAIIGRYANRLAGGRIVVAGRVYSLPCNNGPNCLHGGPHGWQYALFDVAEATDESVELTLTSPDGDNGFPGTVRATVRYSLLGGERLRIDYRAESDAPTVINMTNHSYFNLSGNPETTVHDHLLRIDADRYTPIDETSIPLGEHAAVEGTPFDFRQAKPIGRDIESDHRQLKIGRGYDHNYVLNHPVLGHDSISLRCPTSGIALDIETTAPGVQLYTGNFLDGVAGKGGKRYSVRSAVCLETQMYPDSPNHNWAESTGRLEPDKPYTSTTIFKFSRL